MGGEKKSRLRTARKEKKIKDDSIINFVGCSTSTKYNLENHFLENNMFRYLLFLRTKKVNINKIFDTIINDKKENL